ncbi:two-partner secretion domain-containing protein, partial [Kaarinaea lacus]
MDKAYKATCKHIVKAIIGSTGFCCYLPGVQADVTFDGSMGSTGTLTGPNMEITADMGKIAGNNLYHSFSDFNVNTGQTANFSGPANIQNVFGRITGSNPSNIDGIISSSIQGANLFLMNPNGMLFGPNAQINISGSFHATTADYISLGEQDRFYADINQNTTLSVAAPSAFGFLDNTTGDITINGSTIDVLDGNTVSLVGGNIELSDGSSVAAPDGKINIGSTQSSGEFNVITEQTDLSQFDQLGTINLNSDSTINTNGFEGGKVVIRGGELVLDSSTVSSNSESGFLNSNTIGMDVELSNQLLLKNNAHIAANTSDFSGSDAGDISIAAPKIVMNDYSSIESLSASLLDANSGDIIVKADDIQLSNYSSIKSNTLGTGNSGDISITTSNLDIQDASTVSSVSDLFFGLGGNAGNINIDADSINISGLSGAFDPTFDDFTGIDASGGFLGGASGNIDIHSKNIELANRAWIRSDIYGDVDGGDINIESETLSVVDGARITTSTNLSAQGGSINISSETIKVSGINQEPDFLTEEYFQSKISAATTGSGNAGNIFINSEKLEVLNGATILTPTIIGDGNAGNIDIISKDILISGINEAVYNQELENGSTNVFALESTRSTVSSESIFVDFLGFGGTGGDAGTITLTGENITINDGAWVITRATSDTLSSTVSGDILISANYLLLKNGGSVNTTIENAGNAGNIYINAHSTNIIGSSSELDKTGMFSSTGGNSTGQGGDITIDSTELSIKDGAAVNAETSGSGRGGNINIFGKKLVLTGTNSTTGARSKISASSISTENSLATGDGGNINIESDLVAINESGLIFSGSTGTGSGGNIKISDANRIYISNQGEISTKALQADGGNISLDAESLIYQDNGTVNTSVNGSVGDGGNIQIATNVYV